MIEVHMNCTHMLGFEDRQSAINVAFRANKRSGWDQAQPLFPPEIHKKK